MKIYTKMYSEKSASIPKASPPLVVPALNKTCFAIPFPTEGVLEAVIVGQASTDATPVTAIVEVLCSSIPYPPGNYNPFAQPADTLDYYRVLPSPLVVLPGDVAVMDEEDFGRAFRNIDGTFTMNQRFLYVVIEPDEGSIGPQGPAGSSVTTHWNLTLRCRTDVG